MDKIYLYKATLEGMSEDLVKKLEEESVDIIIMDESGWIKFPDQLPESSQPVFVYDADADMVIEDYFYPEDFGILIGSEILIGKDGSCEKREVNRRSNGFYDCGAKNVTYWMPFCAIDLPDKPAK